MPTRTIVDIKTREPLTGLPLQAALVEALERMLAAHAALMPGLRHISVPDYAEQNDAPIYSRALINHAKSEVATMPNPGEECWNAFAACYRITCMGSAGLDPDRPNDRGYAHATFNLWTIAPGKEPPGETGDAQDLHGRVTLGEFMKIALKNHQARK